MFVLGFLGAHAALGIAMEKYSILATFHAVVTFMIAVYVAMTAKSSGSVICAIAYMGVAEVLWRMASATVFYEFGKYAVSAVLLLWTGRYPPRKMNWVAVCFFLLLLPSVVITCLSIPNFTLLRKTISFNLSGPLALAVCAICLHGRQLRVSEISRLLLTMLGPMIGIAAVCSFGTINLAADYEFGSESSSDTSGGFGPNQVSSILGWASLIAFLWAQFPCQESRLRWIGYLLIVYFLGQSALTFSRTGLWIGIATILTAAAFLMNGRKNFWPVSTGVAVLISIGYLLVFPVLDQFTGGKLSDRFTEKGFSRREDIAKGDLYLALAHPVFGVGLGMAHRVRAEEFGIGGAAHTEFTRLLAEHGSAGLVALGFLVIMALRAWGQARTQPHKAWTASLCVYSMLFMCASGMRLVAPAVAFGLAMIIPVGSRNNITWCKAPRPPQDSGMDLYPRSGRGQETPRRLPAGRIVRSAARVARGIRG